MSEPARASRRFALTLFAVASLVRLGAMLALDTPGEAEGATIWKWGHEAASLARAMLDGRGYGDPWGQGTGASSWLTPPYPLLVAGAFATFGGLTWAAACALFTLQSLVSAATCVALVVLGAEAGARRAGRLAGWMFALYPLAIANSVQLVWDTTLVAGALTGVLVLALRVKPDLASCARAGLGYGALVFLNPAPQSLFPAFALFVAWRARARGLAVFAACAFAVCVPWCIRNWRVLGSPSLRPNFGVEMRIGNHDEANGHPVPFRYHPSHVASELELYKELGEVEYARENWGRAREWITTHPGRFAALTAKRVVIFWVGESPLDDPRRSTERLPPKDDPASWIKFLSFALLGVAGLVGCAVAPLERPARLLFAGSLALFGVPYYLSHVSERYRFPIDPLLCLTSAALVLALVDRIRSGKARA